jgi:hypothetical protein
MKTMNNEELAKSLGLDFVQINTDPNYKQERDALWEAIKTDTFLRLEVLALACELVHISVNDTDRTENRQSFLDPMKKKQIEGIGKRANELGGFRLMQAIAEIAAPHYAHPSDGRMLEFAWDGIGDWRC